MGTSLTCSKKFVAEKCDAFFYKLSVFLWGKQIPFIHEALCFTDNHGFSGIDSSYTRTADKKTDSQWVSKTYNIGEYI